MQLIANLITEMSIQLGDMKDDFTQLRKEMGEKLPKVDENQQTSRDDQTELSTKEAMEFLKIQSQTTFNKCRDIYGLKPLSSGKKNYYLLSDLKDLKAKRQNNR